MKRRSLLLGLLAAPIAVPVTAVANVKALPSLTEFPLSSDPILASKHFPVTNTTGHDWAVGYDNSADCTWARGESPLIHHIDEAAFYPIVPMSVIAAKHIVDPVEQQAYINSLSASDQRWFVGFNKEAP